MREATDQKLSPMQRPKGFTLIELLVVIAIIAILAGLGLAAMGGVMDSARKTEVRAMAHQIKAAIASYYTEYGTFPTNVQTDQTFLRMIAGAETNQNRRGIRFLDVPPKFLVGEDPLKSPIQTPARFYTNNARSNFLIITDAMNQGTDRPYDGRITLPNGKTINGTVAVYVADPKKKGDDAWLGTW